MELQRKRCSQAEWFRSRSYYKGFLTTIGHISKVKRNKIEGIKTPKAHRHQLHFKITKLTLIKRSRYSIFHRWDWLRKLRQTFPMIL